MSSCTAAPHIPPLGHSDLQRHTGVNNLPEVVTRRCSGRESNSQPPNCKSNALTTRLPSHDDVYVEHKRFVFQHLPEPNRASGRCLCNYVRPPTFLIWNNLCHLVYPTPTKTYQSQIPVAFGIPGHVTTKHIPDTTC